MTGETADSLHLSWTVAQGPFDSFLVQYRDRDGQPQTMVVAADQNEVTIDGLQPRRKYKFLLYGLAGGKRLGPVSALGVTGEPPCLTTGLRSLKTKRLAREDGWEGQGPVQSQRREDLCPPLSFERTGTRSGSKERPCRFPALLTPVIPVTSCSPLPC